MPPSLSSTPLDTQTVLILFVLIVIVVIYLTSLLLVVVRRVKKLMEMHNRKYYIVVVFYIASKLALCIILVVQIIVGMTNQWADIDPKRVETYVKVGILMADLSIIELFLIALETYLQYCFSVGADTFTKKRSKLLNNALKGLQITVALTLVIPFVLYVTSVVEYSIVNGIEICLNLLVIISFLVTFFYLNFKMTGLMMDNRLNEVIKRIYKVQLIILVSRACALTFEILVALYVPTSFQDYINTTSIKYEIVLAMVFLGSVLFILITEGLPVMYSLRSAVVLALNHKIESPETRSLEQSIVDKFQDAFEPAPQTQELQLRDFKELRELKEERADSIWVTHVGSFEGKEYLIRISKHEISSYILEDIENEINEWTHLNLRHLSRLSYFCEEEKVHLYERYYRVDLDRRIAGVERESECMKLALSIAEGIKQLHDNEIVHGCLAPHYIFFQDDELLFTGLGLHSLKKYLSLITGYTNKSIYTPIEHLKDRNNIVLKPKKSADIYSFGIILYEMVTRNRHYRQLELKDIQTKFVEECFRPKLPEDIRFELKNLIRKCWNELSEKRPSIEEVIESLRKMT